MGIAGGAQWRRNLNHVSCSTICDCIAESSVLICVLLVYLQKVSSIRSRSWFANRSENPRRDVLVLDREKPLAASKPDDHYLFFCGTSFAITQANFNFLYKKHTRRRFERNVTAVIDSDDRWIWAFTQTVAGDQVSRGEQGGFLLSRDL